MKHIWLSRTLAVCLALMTVFVLLAIPPRSVVQETGAGMALRPPSFVAVANAQSESGASFLETEAGIAAYAQLDAPVDLAEIKSLYRTIELESASYIVGSVPVSDYPESEDVHLYANSEGWIVAYYLAADPVAKIFDWRAYHASTSPTVSTKLDFVLALISDQLGLPPIQATYYDFRYPDANQMTLVVEATNAADSFQIQVPSEFAVSERSWFLGASQGGELFLDGTELAVLAAEQSNGEVVNTLTATQLRPDEFHTVEVKSPSDDQKAYGGLALVYRNQP